MEPQREHALELAKGLAPTPANLERVGDATSAEAAAWAFTQWSLRESARAKFAHADWMLFVREALEQATHERIAAYHASIFPAGAPVADLTCGIGSDLIALAARGPAMGFDLDAERAEYARHNVAAQGYTAQVFTEDSLSAEWTFDYAFADPARRVESRRTLNPSEFAPDPVVLAGRMAKLRLGGIKLSPLLRDDFLELLCTRLEFVSLGGECREALVWLGEEAIPGRFAVHIESGVSLEAGSGGATVEEPGDILFEADPAAIRAHCLGPLCEAHRLDKLGDSNGYLTGKQPVDSPWLSSYRILYHGKADLKATRKVLSDLDSATPIVKQRGTGQDLQALRKQLRLGGKRNLFLALWPVGRSHRHTILEQIP